MIYTLNHHTADIHAPFLNTLFSFHSLNQNHLNKNRNQTASPGHMISEKSDPHDQIGQLSSGFVNNSFQKVIFISKPLLCWRKDLAFLNLRWYLLNLIRALRLCWFAVKNHKRILFVNDAQSIFQEQQVQLFKAALNLQNLHPLYKGIGFLKQKNFVKGVSFSFFPKKTWISYDKVKLSSLNTGRPKDSFEAAAGLFVHRINPSSFEANSGDRNAAEVNKSNGLTQSGLVPDLPNVSKVGMNSKMFSNSFEIQPQGSDITNHINLSGSKNPAGLHFKTACTGSSKHRSQSRIFAHLVNTLSMRSEMSWRPSLGSDVKKHASDLSKTTWVHPWAHKISMQNRSTDIGRFTIGNKEKTRLNHINQVGHKIVQTMVKSNTDFSSCDNRPTQSTQHHSVAAQGQKQTRLPSKQTLFSYGRNSYSRNVSCFIGHQSRTPVIFVSPKKLGGFFSNTKVAFKKVFNLLQPLLETQIKLEKKFLTSHNEAFKQDHFSQSQSIGNFFTIMPHITVQRQDTRACADRQGSTLTGGNLSYRINKNLAFKQMKQRFLTVPDFINSQELLDSSVKKSSYSNYQRLIMACQESNRLQLAKNPWLKQMDLVFFTHPEKARSLVNQMRRFRLPTIGIVSGSHQPQSGRRSRPGVFTTGVDYPIVGNPTSIYFLRSLLRVFIGIIRKANTVRY